MPGEQTMSNCVPHIGSRVWSEGFFATVKFVGVLPNVKGEWVGVEWDDASRGKHDGSHEGISYFKTRHPTSGSFVRSKKLKLGVGLLEALSERYGLVDDEKGGIKEEEMFVTGYNQQVTRVEVVGAKSLNLQQRYPYLSQCKRLQLVLLLNDIGPVVSKHAQWACRKGKFDTLRNISLRDECISGAGLGPRSIGETLPNIVELDLSRNLLSSWEDVAKITQQLPHLRWLNLSENRLVLPENPASLATAFSQLKVLLIAEMDLTWEDVLYLSVMWPSLTEFHVAFNNISHLQPPPGNALENLKLINFEGCKLSSWNELLHLEKLKSIETMMLRSTSVDSISFPDCPPGGTTKYFPNLKTIFLQRNKLSEWIHINELNKLAKLEELRMSFNPITEGDITHQTVRQLLIAKIKRLKTSNGTIVEATERKGAEIDYLKKYGKEWLASGGNQDPAKNKPSASFVTEHPRYAELVECYGAVENSELKVHSTSLKAQLMNLKIDCPTFPEKKALSKKLPVSMTLQKVKVLVTKLLKLGAADVVLTYSREQGREYEMDNTMRELGYFGLEEGDTIHVRVL